MPKRRLKNVNLLELSPVPVAEWEEEDGHVVLLRPPPSGRGWRWVASWLSYAGAARRVRLDEIGTFSWKQLDGTRTVGDIVSTLRETFGDRIEPAEERLGTFVRSLREQGFLAYPGVDTETRP